jgi:hypothetical protein
LAGKRPGDNKEKTALFDRLVSYLIDSSEAMDDIARALALDSLLESIVDCLNGRIDIAKRLMTQVIDTCINPSLI